MPSSIFISYAREDDPAFVERLHADLRERGFHVWWDRKAMESRGRTFLQEIRDAIAGVDRLLLVVGPRAAASSYVRVEWQFALDAGKVVIPILRKGDSSLAPAEVVRRAYESLPTEVAKFHCPSFLRDEDWNSSIEELSRVLRAELPALAAVDGVPALPPNHATRPSLLAQLDATVLADLNRPVTLAGDARTTVLYGMTGAGKTVVASSFAREFRTRRAFGDGICWLTLGRQGNPLEAQLRLADMLGVPASEIREGGVGTRNLARELAHRNCLLILDDVATLAQATSFREMLGARCRLLITTREVPLASLLDAQAVAIEELDENTAIDLLAAASKRARHRLPLEAAEIVRECGRLPLALAMIGATLRARPNRWKQVLAQLRKHELEPFEGALPGDEHRSLRKSLRISVDALRPQTQKRYLECAVFPEDALVPEAVFHTLWAALGLTPDQVGNTLDELVDRSLAFRDARGRVRFHDLQLDFLKAEVGDVRPLHMRLLDSYAAQCNGDWTRGPDDGYFLQQLSHHLVESGRRAELEKLVTSSPHWMRHKVRVLASHQAWLTDLERVASSASDLMVRIQCLALRALTSHEVETVSGAALRTLVLLGRGAEALARARACENAAVRLDMLIAVHEELAARHEPAASCQDELLLAARGIPSDEGRAAAMRDLLERFDASDHKNRDRAFQESRAAARLVPHVWTRALELVRLGVAARRCAAGGADVLDEAWQLIRDRLADDEIYSVQMDTALAFAAAHEFERAEAVANGTTHEGWKLNARINLPKSYAEADRIDEARRRMPRGSDAEREGAPALAAALIRAGRFDEARAWIRARIGSESQYPVLLFFAERLAAKSDRGCKDALKQASSDARRVLDVDDRVFALCAVATVLSELGQPGARRLLAEAETLIDRKPGTRAVDLNAVLEVVRVLAQVGDIDTAIHRARWFANADFRGAALTEVAEAAARGGDHRASVLLEESLAEARRGKDDLSWSQTLRSVVRFLSARKLFAGATAVMQAIPIEHERLQMRIELGRCMAEVGDARAAEVLTGALPNMRKPDPRGYKVGEARAWATAMTLALGRSAGAAVALALRRARTAERSGYAKGQVARLAAKLHEAGSERAETITREAERTARAPGPFDERFYALRDLLDAFKGVKHERADEWLAEAKSLAIRGGKIRDEDLFFRLVHLHVNRDRPDEALALLAQVDNGGWATSEASERIVLSFLEHERWRPAFDLARAIEDETPRAQALVSVGEAAARLKVPDGGRSLEEALKCVGAMQPCNLKVMLQTRLVRLLMLRSDERAEALWIELRAGGTGNDDWSLQLATPLAEVDRVEDALAMLRQANPELLLRALLSWAEYFERRSPQLMLSALTETTRILGWELPQFEALHQVLAGACRSHVADATENSLGAGTLPATARPRRATTKPARESARRSARRGQARATRPRR